MKYSFTQIAKVLEKIFKAGFNSEKKILAINLESLSQIPDLTTTEIIILIDLKKAIRSKKMIDFLSRNENQNEEGGNVK